MDQWSQPKEKYTKILYESSQPKEKYIKMQKNMYESSHLKKKHCCNLLTKPQATISHSGLAYKAGRIGGTMHLNDGFSPQLDQKNQPIYWWKFTENNNI